MEIKQSNKWLILAVIILMYLPVSIDATILHVAAPSLSLDLGASSNEILWIIDIYSLVMACFLLPMGVLGDKYGAKALVVTGTIIFGVASYIAFISNTALMLTFSRGLLALGAAMILPATLSALRLSFSNNRERAIALGIWSAVGTGGAALGPLIGGVLLEYYSWHSVFFINIPICIVVVTLSLRINILRINHKAKKIHILDPLLLITAILLIILFVKSIFKDGINLFLLCMLLIGIIAAISFIKRQRISETAMIDLSLFRNKTILAGIILAMTSMVSLVGFEFFVSQKLQLAMNMTPLEAGLFLLPLILASCLSGPFVGWAIHIIGVHTIAFLGVYFSALSFAGLSFTDFRSEVLQAWAFMICLGFCIEAALLASTTAIMNAAPASKAGEAGAIEGVAYELGAGIGVVVFGLLMSSFFRNNIGQIPSDVSGQNLDIGITSLADAISYAQKVGGAEGTNFLVHAKEVFINSHFNIMITAAGFLLFLSAVVFYLLRETAVDN